MLNMATTIICIILVVICVLGIRSYVKKLSHGCCGSYATVNLNKKTALIRAKEETAEEELRRLVAKSGYSVVKFSKDER